MIDEIEMLSALGLNKFVDPSNLVEKAIERRDNPEKGIALPWSKLSGVELPKTGVTLIGGYSGHSKSTIVNQISLNACAQGHKVCMASLELTSDYLFSMLASQSACMGGDMHDEYLYRFGRWLDQKMFIVDHADTMSMDEAIQLIIDSKRLLGCDMFLLDCLMQVDTGGDLEIEKRLIQQLAATARDYEIAIVVVYHVRKGQGPEGERRIPNKHDFIGSSHLTNAAAAVLILWEDKQKSAQKNNGEDVDDDHPDFILSVVKNRFGPYEGAIGLYKHESARLLCNNRQRQYKPIDLSEGTCTQTPTQPSIELAKASAPVTSLEKKMPESLPEQDSMMLTDPFLSSTP